MFCDVMLRDQPSYHAASRHNKRPGTCREKDVEEMKKQSKLESIQKKWKVKRENETKIE